MSEDYESIADHRREQAIDEMVDQFQGIWPRETIERFLHESEQALGQEGGGLSFLPLRAPSFARERLEALAQVEEQIPKTQPEVLYVCVRNAGRSQMAAALTEHLSQGRISVRSAGSLPGDQIHPVVAEAMAELGLDLQGSFPKPLSDEVVRAADVVITMGCGDACPLYPGKHYEDWVIDNPAGQPLEVVREIRNQIAGRVVALVAELSPEPAAT
ncbi:MAG: low molecular weight phosphatase family protein [Solirubrobacterales bacterium]